MIQIHPQPQRWKYDLWLWLNLLYTHDELSQVLTPASDGTWRLPTDI